MANIKLDTPEKSFKTMESMLTTMEGRLAANPRGSCPVDTTLSMVKTCHGQSCGKCVPCRVGLGTVEDLLEKILDGDGTKADLVLLERTARSTYLTAA